MPGQPDSSIEGTPEISSSDDRAAVVIAITIASFTKLAQASGLTLKKPEEIARSLAGLLL